jgi:uncharacterized protein (TIGR03084 family)
VHEIMTALREQHDELDRILSPLDEDGWKTSSRCAGWSIADVVLHLAQTDEMVVASGEGRFAEATARVTGGGANVASVDEAVEEMVARERGATGSEILARWRAAVEAEHDLLNRCDPRQRLPWVMGDLPARTLATTRLSETWIHTGDVAGGLGISLAPSDRLWHIARLAWRTLPYAFALAGKDLSGPVAVELTAPDGSPWTFAPDERAVTTVRGPAIDFCSVAGRRADPKETALEAEGPDAEAVLDLVRTYA